MNTCLVRRTLRLAAAAICFLTISMLFTSCRSTTVKTQPDNDPTSAIMAEIIEAGAAGKAISVLADNSPEKGAAPEAEAKTARRPHLRIDDGKTERDFLTLLQNRQFAISEIIVINRLILEKRDELKQFDGRLKDEYGILQNTRYHYDQKNMKIMKIIPAPTNLPPIETATADLGEARRIATKRRGRSEVHKVLETKHSAAEFIRITSSKRLTDQQLQSLGLMAREKDIELEKYNAILLGNFAISQTSEYQYDRKTRILYEINPAPLPQE